MYHATVAYITMLGQKITDAKGKMGVDLDRLDPLLSTTILGRPLRYLEAVESTQDVVRLAAQTGAAEGLTVVAGQQTSGRGRADRSWWSPPLGGLYMSLLLRPALQASQVNWITMAATLGTAEAVELSSDLTVGIKWPNDLILRGRKLAGVLAESAFSGPQLEYVVVGLGLNVNTDFAGHPELAQVATSLRTELARVVDISALLAAILARIEHHYLALKQGLSPQPAWTQRLVNLGRPVTATAANGQQLSGVAYQVQPDGGLCIRLPDGRHEVIQAGDITLGHAARS